MSLLRILRKDIVREATGNSVSPALVSGMGADIGQQDNRKTSRTTSTASQDINYTWTSNQIVNMVAVARHNWSDAATLRVRLYSDTALTTLLYDSTALDAFDGSVLPAPFSITHERFRNLKNTVFYFSEQTTVKGLKLTIADASNPDGYMEHARVLAGQYFQPAYGAPYGGASLKPASASKVRRTDGGDRIADQRGTWRELSLNLHQVPDSDYDDFASIVTFHDKVLPTWVSVRATAGGALELMNQMWAGIDDMGPFDPAMYGLHRLPLVFGEV